MSAVSVNYYLKKTYFERPGPICHSILISFYNNLSHSEDRSVNMVFFLCEKKAYIFDIQRPYLFCTLSAPSRGKIWNFFPHHLSLRYMNEFLVYMALPEQCAVCSFACQHPTWTIFTWMIFNFHWSHGIESFLWVIQCCSMRHFAILKPVKIPCRVQI